MLLVPATAAAAPLLVAAMLGGGRLFCERQNAWLMVEHDLNQSLMQGT